MSVDVDVVGRLWVVLWISLYVVCSVSILPKKVAFLGGVCAVKFWQVIQNASKFGISRKIAESSKKVLRVLVSNRRTPLTGGVEARYGSPDGLDGS